MSAINSLVRSGNERSVIAGDLSGSAKPQNLEQAAEKFEALFLKTMLQQMRKASDVLAGDDDPFGSKQQRMMRDYHDDILATQLASQGSVGIADLLIKQLGSK